MGIGARNPELRPLAPSDFSSLGFFGLGSALSVLATESTKSTLYEQMTQ
jgi:hypothetical protein